MFFLRPAREGAHLMPVQGALPVPRAGALLVGVSFGHAVAVLDAWVRLS
jgi:hypothetical protein